MFTDSQTTGHRSQRMFTQHFVQIRDTSLTNHHLRTRTFRMFLRKLSTQTESFFCMNEVLQSGINMTVYNFVFNRLVNRQPSTPPPPHNFGSHPFSHSEEKKRVTHCDGGVDSHWIFVRVHSRSHGDRTRQYDW